MSRPAYRSPGPGAPWCRRGVILMAGGLLVGGCAAPADGLEPDTDTPAAADLPAQARSDTTQVPPLVRILARATPAPARTTDLLEELRQVVDSAGDEGLGSASRRRAADRADDVLAELGVLEDWRPLVRAELLAPLGDTAEVDRALDRMAPGSELYLRWGWAFRIEAREAAGDTVGAWRAAEAEARRARTPAEGADAWARAGRLALARADSLAARSALLRALGAGAGHPGARSAARALDGIHDGSPAEALLMGRALLAAGAWDAAHRRLAPVVLSGNLDEVDEAELRVELGRALVELRRPAEALAMVGPVTGEAVPVALAAPALYWQGQAALQAGRPAEAESAFLRLARRAPESPLAEEGMLRLVERSIAAGRQHRDEALIHEFLRVGVGSAGSELVAVQLGSRQYLSGDFAGAADTFDRYLEGARRPGTRQQAAYWAALAHARLGDGARARDRWATAWADDPLSFYGILAGERLDAVVLDPGLSPGPTPVPGLRAEVTGALVRLEVHRIVPTAGSLAFELERLQEHFFRRGDGAYDFAEALFGGGFAIQGVVLGREIHRREGEWNLRLLRIVFPLPHRDALVREARARGLDPFFVAGLIRQESMFDAAISSPAGAVGLMQLMPATAREVSRSLGLRYDAARLSDPEFNLALGTEYLASMLRRFGGRAEDALSAYNAGPGRITQWRQRPEYGDRDVFMEHIPFRETRHYVKVVQQYARIYTALYGCPGFAPCLGDSYLTALGKSPYAGGAPASSVAR
jgi:soluble lytic murein transglycosylase